MNVFNSIFTIIVAGTELLLLILFLYIFSKNGPNEKKLKRYLLYLENKNFTMDPVEELKICERFLKEVTSYLIITEGRGPEYIRTGEIILHQRESELKKILNIK